VDQTLENASRITTRFSERPCGSIKGRLVVSATNGA
jgi:hypothetical protein